MSTADMGKDRTLTASAFFLYETQEMLALKACANDLNDPTGT